MRLFVRLSFIGLVALVAIGFAVNSFLQADGKAQSTAHIAEVIVDEGFCMQRGVSLTVDFGTNESIPAIDKCIRNFTKTSWDLLNSAQLTVTGTQKYPVGFVCRINGFPSDAVESCNQTPDPKVGSWAYFVAGPGSSSWQYSTWGASTHKPACGSAEAWVFRYPEENLEALPTTDPQTRVCPN
ncbi:MAG: flagellar hook-length control protein FliK [Actinomycetes bacterium]